MARAAACPPSADRPGADRLADRAWRLSNLYWVVDKDGRRVRFAMNWAQEALFREMSHLNVVLKARQLGFTTFIQLFMLDACLFNSNVQAGTIAHTLGDAQSIFRTRIKYPYDNLPEGLRAANPAVKDSANELLLANNSGIRVATSMRSGTLQYLHVSEYGKLCARFPDKAREVRTGALNTIQAGQIAWIESTAEGQEGDFYELCEASRARQRTGEPLTPLDFQFHFFPWWRHPDYRLEQSVSIAAPMAEYFERLRAEHGIVTSPEQQAWYVKKAEQQGADIKREFPSTPEEAFEAAVEGAYYGAQIAEAEQDKRIGDFPVVEGIPVHTAWDLGVGDDTAIWLFQVLHGGLRIVACHAAAGEGVGYYADWLEAWRRKHGASWGNHRAPHDAKVKEWGSGRTRIEAAWEHGLHFWIVPQVSVDDGIQAARLTIPRCAFDAAACAEGLKALKAYRKEWNERLGTWADHPRHDWASHYADAFRYLALAWRAVQPPKPPVKPVDDWLPRRRRDELGGDSWKTV